MNKRRTIKLLQDARQLLVDKGWTRGTLHKHGRYCAIGALYKASSPTYDGHAKAFSALRDALPVGFTGPAFFNDSLSAKDKQVILDLYTIAIRNVRKGTHERLVYARKD